MKEKRDCKIVQDLLPNYIEKLTDKETNNFIEEHLRECVECHKVLDNMKRDLQVNTDKRDDREVKYIKKYSNKLRVLELSIIIILLIALGVMTYYYFYFRNAWSNASNALVEIASEERYPDTFYATIEEITDSEVYGIKEIKIKGLNINDINHRGEFYFDVLLDNVKIKWNEENVDFEQLKVGQTISVYNYGNILESEPKFLSSVGRIVILNDKI